MSTGTRIACTTAAAAFLLLIVPTAGVTAEERGASQYYEDGLSAYLRDDVVEAMALLERGVELDDTRSQVLLARILDKAEEDARAVQLYQLAADKGDPEGELGLGSMYASGEGVATDHAKGVHWIERAANQGLGPAIVILADAYMQGQLGLDQDRERAIEWLERGAASGYEPARLALEKLEAGLEQPGD